MPSADSAGNAGTLGGHGAGFYAPLGAEAVHVVGASGQIPFGSGWGSGADPGEEVPGFWKDPAGTVHLRGAISRSSGTGSTVFTLPPGYRPAKLLWFITYGSGATQAYVNLNGDGRVVYSAGKDETGEVDNSSYVGLSNITFRADH